ncbi:uncharacterized protein HaLaN_01557 [Haematococcus lacustris]|uniref:Uncharacterized protein n=1 Tax=Haematococcus lacustris TaxID=44745 RepID=A0A699YLG7_HAELA|nr:uncharacterized protein HaLaN_01557 [Haematococcus lacustris]
MDCYMDSFASFVRDPGGAAIALWGLRRNSLAVLRFGATLLAFYLSSSQLTQFKEELKVGLDDAGKLGGQRDWKQAASLTDGSGVPAGASPGSQSVAAALARAQQALQQGLLLARSVALLLAACAAIVASHAFGLLLQWGGALAGEGQGGSSGSVYSGFNRATGRVTSQPGPLVTHIAGRPWLDNNAVNMLSASLTAALTALATLKTFGG